MEFPTGYDNDLALELAHLSLAAYDQYHAFIAATPWTVPSGYSLEVTMTAVYESGNPPIGFIASKGAALYVVWRGTSDASEWLVDAEFEQTSCSFLSGDELIEIGFHELYTTGSHAIDSPQDTVINYLTANADKFSSLYVTGHSLGGALAVLNAAEIAHRMPDKTPIMISFAGPRVGSPSFARTYNGLVKASWRVANTDDEVPKVPPTSMGTAGYEHVNQQVSITFGGRWPWEWGKDHSLLNYIKRLKAL